jgi:hypothetical protein
MLAGPADDFTGRMFRALNSMMLDMLAAIARKHYDDRRRRQAQGVAKAKAEGKHRPQRRDCFDATPRFVMDGDSGRLRMQPGEDRQGRQASRAGIARRADELLDAAVYPASVAFRPRPAKK